MEALRQGFRQATLPSTQPSWSWGPCVMWEAGCISGKWCSAPFFRKSNSPLVFHLCLYAHRGDFDSHNLALVKNKVLQFSYLQPVLGPHWSPWMDTSNKTSVSGKLLWGLVASGALLSKERFLWCAGCPHQDLSGARSCCEAALITEHNTLTLFRRTLNSGVLAASAEMFLCLHSSLPFSYSFAPLANTAPAASGEGQGQRATEMRVFSLPVLEGT